LSDALYLIIQYNSAPKPIAREIAVQIIVLSGGRL
jgi:hypothetical protein